MSYLKTIVCLAASDREGGLCIAGREVLSNGYGAWIRPVSDRSTRELVWSDYRYPDLSSPKLLDIIDVPLLEPLPTSHQQENHRIDASQRWIKKGQLAFSDLVHLKESPFSLWTNAGSTNAGLNNCISPDVAATHNNSLYLLHPESFFLKIEPDFFTRRRRYIGQFQVGRHTYWLQVTDPTIKQRFKSNNDGEHEITSQVYLCVSLTEQYSKDGRCHKLVASVITEHPL